MNADQVLIVLAISAYIAGTIALLLYFLTRDERAKRIGIPFAFLGCITQLVELAYRYESSKLWPMSNLYGSLSFFAAMSVAIFLVFAVRYDLWFIGGFVQAIASIALAYALTWDEGYRPLVPALQSYWIKIHVPIVVSSYAAFLVAFVTSVVYLVKYYAERNVGRGGTMKLRAASAGGPDAGLRMQALAPERPRSIIVGDAPNLERAAVSGDSVAGWLASFPTLAKLDIMAYRIIAVGLLLLSIGVITGAIWAHEAWGAYWSWDPKEDAALASWIVYAFYMHVHTRNAWRGVRCAWLSVLGFATIMFCYLGVNIWISGLHSYKM